MAEPNTLEETFSDGSIRFTPPESKQSANYRESPSSSVPSQARCGNCAHYIPGGGCHVVQGAIDPGAVCLEFYADVGIFADNEFDPSVSMVLDRGGVENWTEADVRRFIADTRAKIEGNMGGGGSLY